MNQDLVQVLHSRVHGLHIYVSLAATTHKLCLQETSVKKKEHPLTPTLMLVFEMLPRNMAMPILYFRLGSSKQVSFVSFTILRQSNKQGKKEKRNIDGLLLSVNKREIMKKAYKMCNTTDCAMLVHVCEAKVEACHFCWIS